MIEHPEVEVYYERENGEEYLSEDYDVFVDEDCTTCHNEFIAQKHFSPLIPAHNLNSNWNDLPWWLDTKYLMFFKDRDDSSSSSGISGYQHVSTQRRNNIPPPQQGGYVSGSGGSTTNAGAQNVPEVTNANEGSSSESNSRSRSGVSSQNSGGSSRSSASASKRKFRKRK